MFVHLDQVRTLCTLSPSPPPQGCRIPAPVLSSSALPCQPVCCLPSDTRSQHVDDSYIILGLPPRSDSRSPDGGYNNSRTSRTSFSTACRRRPSSHPTLKYNTHHCSPVVTASQHQTAHTNKRHPSPAHLHINKATKNRHTGCTHLHAQPTPPRRNQLWFPKGVYQGHHRP